MSATRLGARARVHEPRKRRWKPLYFPASRSFQCISVLKPEDERALRLPAPERADREHHDVALADGRVDDLRTVLEVLAAEHAAREQHVARVGREPQDHARLHEVEQRACRRRHRRRTARRHRRRATAATAATARRHGRHRPPSGAGAGGAAGVQSFVGSHVPKTFGLAPIGCVFW